MHVKYLTPPIEDRAGAVQGTLGVCGSHRAASIPDFRVAATTELAQITVLHHHKNFDLIAGITTQSVQ